jgi:beta-aspartyl-dipeptidase (metallo-type)
MFTLLKEASIYSPDFLGKKDILFCFDKIAAIKNSIDPSALDDVEVLDCSNKLIFPGFIDLHVHIAGGGGEGGFSTRTPSATADDILKTGVTTVVGVLGADGVTRSVENLYAQAKQLEAGGLSTYMYTGSYQVPVVTLTGSIQKDIVFVDKIIGVGELCLEDHRAFQPTFDEIARIAAQTRNGALISGKAGLVHFHMGLGETGLEYLFRMMNETLIPVSHFLPTHVNRTGMLFEQACSYLQKGGYIDLTAGFIPSKEDPDCVASYDALKKLVDTGADIGRVTMSSDAYGSVPVFDGLGNVISSDTVTTKILFDELKVAIKEKGIPIETAISLVTKNAAGVLKIHKQKGSLETGKDADCVICDKDLNIETVFAKGIKYS